LLRIWVILTAASALFLIAASCAQEQTAVEAYQAAQAATIASTEAYQDLQQTATQMSAAFVPSSTQPNPAPPIPGSTVVQSPDSFIIVQNGQVIIIKKSSIYGYNGPPQPH
jgi:PBP1b-binding outer membrane lipoprotein LpoB